MPSTWVRISSVCSPSSGERGFLERIGLGARLFRGDIDGDHFIAALQERFQHGLSEGLLAMNYDTHLVSLAGKFLSAAVAEVGWG
jgi:hypothetical protein